MITVLLCSVFCIAGILVGWFARELRDILRTMLEIYRKLHYQQNKTARAGVIVGGVAYSQGKEKQPDEIVLEDYQPEPEPQPKRAGIIRRMSVKDHAAMQEKAHKDEMAQGK